MKTPLNAERQSLDDRFVHGERSALIAGYQALAETEGDIGLYRRLAICLFDTKLDDGAKAAFARVLKFDSTDASAKRHMVLLNHRAPKVPAPKKKAVRKKVVSTPE